MSRNVPILAAALGLALLTACHIPRAKLHNLREVHSDSGNVSYRGNVQSDLVYALTRSLGASPLTLGSESGFGQGERQLDDPLEIVLDNLVDLGRMDRQDPLTRGIQVEAFGWLAVDDQYVLGRERAVLELGKQLVHLGLEDFVTPPAEPVGPDELSPVLADLARAGLGSLPEAAGLALDPERDAPPTLDAAIAEVRALPLDRDGALRALAVVNILFERSDALLSGAAGADLRVLATELRGEVVGQALYSAARDDDPLVRAACATAMTRLGERMPAGVLRGFMADPSPSVAVVALRHAAAVGVPLGDDLLLQGAARDGWVELLMAYAQFPESRRSAYACAALGRVAEAGFTSMRAEDWATWWRRTRPDQPLPSLVGS